MKPALGTTPAATLLVIDHVNTLGDGTSTLSRLDGSVISCQPDGILSTRPAGTAGPWEVCVVGERLVTFCPDGHTAYSFPFCAGVPNS